MFKNDMIGITQHTPHDLRCIKCHLFIGKKKNQHKPYDQHNEASIFSFKNAII